MNREFIPYEQALALKELGFDEPCLAFKDFDHSLEIGDITKNSSWSSEIISVPLYQQAFSFFREKYKLHQVVLADEKGKYDIIVGERISGSCLGQYETYEEAELECLKKLIEIVKSK